MGQRTRFPAMNSLLIVCAASRFHESAFNSICERLTMSAISHREACARPRTPIRHWKRKKKKKRRSEGEEARERFTRISDYRPRMNLIKWIDSKMVTAINILPFLSPFNQTSTDIFFYPATLFRRNFENHIWFSKRSRSNSKVEEDSRAANPLSCSAGQNWLVRKATKHARNASFPESASSSSAVCNSNFSPLHSFSSVFTYTRRQRPNNKHLLAGYSFNWWAALCREPTDDYQEDGSTV